MKYPYSALFLRLGLCLGLLWGRQQAAAQCGAVVSVTPPGPVSLPSGGSQVLTASVSNSSFNPGKTGFNDAVDVVALQADGKLIVSGDFTSYSGRTNRLLRLNADGSLDATFNPGGSGPNNNVQFLQVQADGKILVGGNFTSYNGNAAAPDRLIRLNADGTLDAGFNAGGSGASGAVYTVLTLADNRLLVGGCLPAITAPPPGGCCA